MSPLRFLSGLDGHPGSHCGQPVSDDWLIIALAPVCMPNGATPEAWVAMKLVPQLSACAAVHDVPVPPVSGVPAAMTAGWKTKVLPVTEMLRATHWQPSQYEMPSGATGPPGTPLLGAYSWHVPALVTFTPTCTAVASGGDIETSQAVE
jgi:hypothetical protein